MRKNSMLRVLLIFSLTLIGTALLRAANWESYTDFEPQESPATQKAVADITGTWSGTFQSKSNAPSFTMTIVIDRGAQGGLVAQSSQDSTCFKDLSLQVTVKGKQVVLAGSDDEGNSVTVRGKIDNTGTLLALKYIINGSAGGRCESDTGTGTLGRR